MPGTRIVIPDDFPSVFHDHPALSRLAQAGQVVVHTAKAPDAAELARRLEHATIVVNVRAFTRFDEALLEQLPCLRLIAIVGTGSDHIDLEAAERLGVAVSNAPGANARSVAEHTIALLLALARQIPLSDRETRAGLWRHHEGMELEGKTLGVIGLGAIGSRVAQMASGLGLRVVAWSFTRDEARARACGAELLERDDLLRQSDIVSLHLPATPESRGMLGARELALLKPGAYLINTARAALVDEAALLTALRSGHLAGAGFDVFESEPLPADSPFFALPNVVLTPHIGWVTHEASERLVVQPIETVLGYLAGQPRYLLNPGVLTHPRQTART